MSIDNIVPFLFIAFWIVSAVVKQNLKDKKGGKGNPNNSISNLIKKAVESFAEGIEQNSNDEIIATEPFSYNNLELEENDIYGEEGEEEEVGIDKLEKPILQKIETVTSDDNYNVRDKTRNSKFSKVNLKEAFVWSEILNSPVSLRE